MRVPPAIDARLCKKISRTANSFVTVSPSPMTVLVPVMPGRMHRAISATGRYCVAPFRQPADHGVTPDYDIVNGLPRLAGCIAWFACEVTRHVDVSDHTLIIAEVSTCDYRDHHAAGVLLQPLSSRAGGLLTAVSRICAHGFGVFAGRNFVWEAQALFLYQSCGR